MKYIIILFLVIFVGCAKKSVMNDSESTGDPALAILINDLIKSLDGIVHCIPVHSLSEVHCMATETGKQYRVPMNEWEGRISNQFGSFPIKGIRRMILTVRSIAKDHCQHNDCSNTNLKPIISELEDYLVDY